MKEKISMKTRVLSFILALCMVFSMIPMVSFGVSAATDYSLSQFCVNFEYGSKTSWMSYRDIQMGSGYSLTKIMKQLSITDTLDSSRTPYISSYYSESKDKGKVTFTKSGSDYLIGVSSALNGYVKFKFYYGKSGSTREISISTVTGSYTEGVNGSYKAYICGAARQEKYPLRVGELLEVHTEGFPSDDTFTYQYILTNTNSTATSSSCYLHSYNSSNMAGDSGTQKGMQSSFSKSITLKSKFFAMLDSSGNRYHKTSTVKIRVISSKTGVQLDCSYTGFADGNLEEDCKNANFIMFEGESATMLNLFGLSGITHITCSNCSTKNVTLDGTLVTDGSTVKNDVVSIKSAKRSSSSSIYDQTVTALKEGKTKCSVTVVKNTSCDHHCGQTADTNTSIWVIKKPVFIDNGNGTITVTNITKGVNYTINNITLTAGDDPTLVFKTTGNTCRLTAEDGDAFLFRDFPITLVQHTHSWSYSVKSGAADTLVAKCSDESTCTDTNPREITVVAPSDTNYDGNPKSASLNQTAFAGQTSVPTIEYYQGTTKLSGPPSAAGNYTAQITVGGATAKTTFSIVKPTFAITCKNDGNGTISASASSASEGDNITLTPSPNAGYEVDEITVNGTKISGTSFTMPAKATEVSVKFKAKTNTAYKVHVYVMGTDGKYPTTYSTYDYTGTTGATATVTDTMLAKYCTDAGSVKAFSKDTNAANVLSGTIAGNGSLVLTVYLKRAQYKLTLNAGTGIKSTTGSGTFYYGVAISGSAELKEGYNTIAWSKAIPRTMPDEDFESTASATANTDTKYKIHLYVMGTDGKYPTNVSKEYNPDGTTDTTITITKDNVDSYIADYCTANYKSDENAKNAFSWDETKDGTVKSGTITGDGNLVLKIYIKRASYELTLTADTGVKEVKETTSNKKNYYYGETITPTATEKDGYGTPTWTPSAPSTMPASALSLTASAEPKTDTKYKIHLYVMGTDGKYPTNVSKEYNREGTTDTTVTLDENAVKSLIADYCTATYKSDANAKNAFSWDSKHDGTVYNGKIVADKDNPLTLKLYIERASYQLTLNKGTGIDSVSGAGTYYYGATISPSATALNGNGTPTWDPEAPSTMPASALTLTASASALTTGYKVQVFVMGTDGNYPSTKTKEYDCTGTIGGTAEITQTAVNGYIDDYCTLTYSTDTNAKNAFSWDETKAETVKSGTIVADKDNPLILKVYIKRATYKLTLSEGTGIKSTTGSKDSVYYGETITKSAELKPGYNTVAWTPVVPSTMPAKDFTSIATATPNTDTSYKVHVYVMGADGKYTDKYTNYDYTGTTDTTAEVTDTMLTKYCTDAGSSKAFSKDTNKTNVLSGNIAGDGSLVLTVYLKRAQYKLTLTAGTGIKSTTGSGTFYYGATISGSAELKAGYNTVAWSKAIPSTMPDADFESTATATPNTDTAYKVHVYVMGADGKYTDKYTNYDYTGTTDTTAEVTDTMLTKYCTDAGSLKAFSKDTNKTNVLSGNIAGDGSLVLTVYLKRAQYKLTLTKGTGVDSVSGAGTFYYGATISPSATASSGYGTPTWDKSVPATMPDENLTLEASAEPKTDTKYKVHLYVMGTDGTYPTNVSKEYNPEGKTNSTVTLTKDNVDSYIADYCTATYKSDANAKDAFSWDETKDGTVYSGTITGDGNLVLKIYIKRASYKLTLIADTGVKEVKETTSNKTNYYYGETITPTATQKDGYKTPTWDKTPVPSTMPASALTITASADPKTDTAYNVHVYVMGTDGNYTDKYTNYDYKGTTDTTAEVTDTMISGYCTDAGSLKAFSKDTNKDNVLSGNIAGDGSLVLTVYLKRAQYKLTLTADTGVKEVKETTSNKTSYYFGETITPTATEKDGYKTPTWDKSVPSTMPDEDLALKASADPKTDTKYLIHLFVMDTTGTYPTIVSKEYNRNGTTDTTVTLDETAVKSLIADYCTATYKSDASAKDAFSWDSTYNGTVKSGKIVADKDNPLTLKLYIKRAYYKLTLSAGSGVDSTTGSKDNCYYGETINATATPKAGYDTPTWNPSVPATMPASNFSSTATAQPKSDTEYKVQVFVMGTDGKYPTSKTKEYTPKGTTDATVTLTKDNVDSYIADYCTTNYSTDANAKNAFSWDETKAETVKSGTIVADKDNPLILKVYIKRATYKLTLSEGTGIKSTTGSKDSVYYGETITKSAELKPGYNTVAWTPVVPSTMPAKDFTSIATATPNTDTAYKVHVYVMGADGKYTDKYTNYDYTGTTDTTAEVTDTMLTKYCTDAGSLKAFSKDTNKTNVLSGNIAGDGSLVLTVYLKRAQYKLTLTAGTGIKSTTGSGTFYYGATISGSAELKAGYNTVAWSKAIPSTMPDADFESTASATPNTDTEYNVHVYVMGADGKYTDKYTNYDYTGTTDTTATVTDTMISGYCTDAGSLKAFSKDTNKTNVLSGNIAGDGSLVLTVYLKRAQYKLTLTAGTGIKSTTGSGTFYYGATISGSAELKAGYNTVAWSKAIPSTMPDADFESTATATANTDTSYKVHVYVMGADGKYTDKYTNYDYTGTTDTTATVTTDMIKGYCKDAGSEKGYALDTDKKDVLSGNIAGDGSLVINVHLKRNQFTITYVYGTGGTVSGKATAIYGEEVAISTTTDDGYRFISVSAENANKGTVKIAENKFTMPDSNVTVTAVFSKIIKVEYSWGEHTPSNVDLPADIKNIAGEKYSLDTATTKDVKVIKVAENGGVEGYYVFNGWSDPYNGVVPTADGTITAKWTFDANEKQTITYNWGEHTPKTAKPADIKDYVNAKYDVDTTITNTTKVAKVADNGGIEGYYVFDGWSDPNNNVMPANGGTITAKWTWVPNEKVKVPFETEKKPDGFVLPNIEEYPEGKYPVEHPVPLNTPFPVYDPENPEVIIGYDVYKGYEDPNNGKIPEEGKDPEPIVIKWEYKEAKKYTVKYSWGEVTPNGVGLPESIVGYKNVKYTVDTTITSETKVAKVADNGGIEGYYVFNGWSDPNNGVIPENGGTITAIWKFEPSEKVEVPIKSEKNPEGFEFPKIEDYPESKYPIKDPVPVGTKYPVYDPEDPEVIIGYDVYEGFEDPNKDKIPEEGTNPKPIEIKWGYEDAEKFEIKYSWGTVTPDGTELPIDENTYYPNAKYVVDDTIDETTVIIEKDEYGNPKTKYTFDGWNKEDGRMPDGGLEIEAKWKVEELEIPERKITYQWGDVVPKGIDLPVDNNTYVKNQPYTLTEDIEIGDKLYVYDKFGNIIGEYEFEGWTDSGNGVIGETDPVITGNWTFTEIDPPSYPVEYKDNEYKGTYAIEKLINGSKVIVDPNGGSWNYGDKTYKGQMEFTVDGPVKMEDPTRKGYTFAGWEEETMEDGTVFLKAKWKKNPKDSNNPNTGDINVAWAWMTMLASSGIAFFTKKKGKKEEDED